MPSKLHDGVLFNEKSSGLTESYTVWLWCCGIALCQILSGAKENVKMNKTLDDNDTRRSEF